MATANTAGLHYEHLPTDSLELRAELREFLAEQTDLGRVVPCCDSWLSGWDPDFSAELGRRGWIGMTLPVEYGGHGRSALDRFVVLEELLAAGAPVAAHWVADRQSGPSILRFGSEEQRTRWLPRIASGQCYFGIGMSEPDAGSDLAAIRTSAAREGEDWVLNGTKLWTSGAHRAHALIVLARTASSDDRHGGLSQFIVELPSPGVTVRPILTVTGEHHFNEVAFEGVRLERSALLGGEGDGWKQVTAELALERSGPERFLSTMPLLSALAAATAGRDRHADAEIGRLFTRLWVLRRMSIAVASALSRGEVPDTEAALVKDLGTRFEGDVVETSRRLLAIEPDPTSEDPLARLLAEAVSHSPGFTLRGGTNEILRGVVARKVLGR